LADNRGIYISLIAHAALIAFTIIKVSLFAKPELNFSEAIRVDMVGLPEKYTPSQEMPEKIEPKAEDKPAPAEEKKSEAKVEAKPEPAKKDPAPEISLNKSKQKQKEAMEKLKKLSAIEKIRQQVQNEKASKPIKGRVISKGTSLTGIDRLQSENYLVQLDGLIKSKWQLPQWLIGKPLKTKVLVKINPKGAIVEKKVVQTSGNPTYDDYCMQAIEKASPFPQVPEKFTEIYEEDGVLFGFPE
jgi:colicin import membrane protein